MEFKVLSAQGDVAGRRLLGLGLEERAAKMLLHAGLREAGTGHGDLPLVVYPGELVGPMKLGAEIRGMEPGPDDVIEASVPGALGPVRIFGAAARSRLDGNLDFPATGFQDGTGKVVAIALSSPAVSVIDSSSRGAARRMLLESLRKPIDGLVSRTLNRPLSIAMSSVLVSTPLTPNMLSTITFILALAAAWMMGQSWFVAGALLMHVASVLDGCDGEVARLKYQTSRLGGWLDTVYDDISNSVFAVMTGVGLYRAFAGDAWGQGLLGMAVLGVVLALPALAVTYARLIKANTSDSGALDWGNDDGASPLRRFLLRYLSPLVKRDAYLLIFLVFAIVGLPEAIVVFYFIGSAIASATMLTQVLRSISPTG